MSGFWGLVLETALFAPIPGKAGRSTVGGIAGKTTEFGIDKKFAKLLAEKLIPDTSAVLMLVKNANQERLVEEMKIHGGEIILTNLPEDIEHKLTAAMLKQEKQRSTI